MPVDYNNSSLGSLIRSVLETDWQGYFLSRRMLFFLMVLGVILAAVGVRDLIRRRLVKPEFRVSPLVPVIFLLVGIGVVVLSIYWLMREFPELRVLIFG